MATIIVTGGGGYIGSHAVKRLLKDGNKVIVLDNFYRGYKEPLEILKKYGELVVCEGDITKKDEIKKAFNYGDIDAVMHFAALCLVDESVREPAKYFKINTEGTVNLLEVMEEFGVKKIIFSSTCAVYGEAKYLPIDENHPTNPLNPYGESKLRAAREIEKFGELHGFKYVLLRYFNVCGADPEGEIGDSKKPSELLVQNAVRGALGIEPFKLTCPQVNTPDGTPVRDYVDINDIIDAHVLALKYLNQNGSSITVNLGTGKGWSVKEIVSEVESETGKVFEIIHGNTRQGEYATVFADNKLAYNTLGWAPKRTLKDSIKSLVQWYQKKPDGYKS
jgi:UDP-glucose 4-epimerase